MFITKNKQKELIQYIKKQYSEMSDSVISELASDIEYTFKEMHENNIKSKRFSIDSEILDIFIVINVHSGKIDVVNWRPSDCPEFKYNGLFPACAKTHIVYLDEI